MKIRILQVPGLSEPEIEIRTETITDEIRALAARLEQPDTLCGYGEKGVYVLKTDDILRIYAQGQKVYAQCAQQTYVLHSRLYELEERLEGSFLRISNAELVNKNRIVRLDTSMTGTVCVMLEGGVQTYASRRYVARIRRAFRI